MRHVSPPFDPPSPSQAARLHTSSRTRAINSSCPSREAEPFFTSRAARVQAEPSLTRDYSIRARPSRAFSHARLLDPRASKPSLLSRATTRSARVQVEPSLTRDYSSRARPSRAFSHARLLEPRASKSSSSHARLLEPRASKSSSSHARLHPSRVSHARSS
ncbi:hypothetical protein Csa_001748 [Cucumis sativus]|nr:hypothetical protein Csa_001748 [Cucumis sativus]